MTRTVTDRPTDAEMIQTACRRVSDAILAVEGAESTGTDTGAIDPIAVNVVHLFESQAFVLVPTGGDAMAAVVDAPDGVAAMLEITDCAPIDLRERVRSLIWLKGVLHPVPADLERDLAIEIAAEHPDGGLLDIGHGSSMLRLQIDSAVIASGSGAASVSAAELADATPDPFWEYENGWIAHLDADHADIIDQLVRRLPRHLRKGRIRPLGLDRFGIRFRIETVDGDSDVRLPFPRPVTDVYELSHALRSLAGCPFMNSLPD
ncbi:MULTISPECIES: DUF2470 domain-containing protein [unclassified Gordonia (in: high G+C Gram-positive bacteria)]|uniref:DUF2470 domain-containing protein n=1 Tax=unclassified Gordonia (in: high G+C Gram-positive bacteria) TaxID=2657482 RepID=UPI001F0D4552|nr:DUF2470 domain-containing protein [Gordonia sp. ABSL49_1]MCH5642864.1 DUF2470 domain-containing protein [Gordonia sp. ABSL49_1]